MHILIKFLLFTFVIFQSSLLFAEKLLWNESTADILQTANIIKCQEMRDFLRSEGREVKFTSEVYIVTFDAKDAFDFPIRAVFKPCDNDFRDEALAEVAAYQASEMLGFHNVPPTVFREYNGQLGSLQLYIQPDFDAISNDFKLYKEALNKELLENKSNRQLFNFIFGQWDSGPENIIIKSIDGKLWLFSIDNANICQRQKVEMYGELPFVRAFQQYNKGAIDINSFVFPDKDSDGECKSQARQELIDVYGEEYVKSACGSEMKWIVAVDYDGYLWNYYYSSGLDKFVTQCSQKTYNRLLNLNLESLKEIFKEAIAHNASFCTPAYFDDILKRRDMALAAIEPNRI